MKLLNDLTDLRRKTIEYWTNFKYPGSELDIRRVYAFRELNPDTATNADVSAAYEGHGWAPQAPCAECGVEANIEFGGRAFCITCVNAAANMLIPTPPEPVQGSTNLFTRFFKKA